MRWQERQDRVEAAVYEAIDELADVLNLEVPFYPEVFWIGRTVVSKDLMVPKNLEAELAIRISHGISYYIVNSRIIVIAEKATTDTVLEESSHAFHFLTSGISYKGRSYQDSLALSILVELMGLLGARLIGSDFNNPYEVFPDLALWDKESCDRVRQNLIEQLGDDFDFQEFFIHQQGYGLADRIFYRYLSGGVKLSYIRRLFLNKFDRRGGATEAYGRLRNRFWPPGFQLIGTKAVA